MERWYHQADGVWLDTPDDLEPMYTAIGILPPDVAQAAKAAMPPCYTNTLDDCLDDANRGAPGCERYEPLHVAFDTDYEEAKAIIDGVAYCNYGRDQLMLAVGVGAGVGLLLGFVIGSAAA